MSRAKAGKVEGDRSREELAPRERILAAAGQLFYSRGIRSVSVDEIAAAADTNKMTLYRHFESKDQLIAEYLRQLAAEADASWSKAAQARPGDARAQLEWWAEHLCKSFADPANRGCALANAAVEIPEKDHPARQVIEKFKRDQRERLAKRGREAGFREPEKLADEIFLLLEGARMNMQSLGPKGPCHRLGELLRAVLKGSPRNAAS
jgi:AcrR family transcriptional regulator